MTLTPKLRYSIRRRALLDAKELGIHIPLAATEKRLQTFAALPKFGTPGISIRDIATAQARDFNSVSTMIRELEAGGFALRTQPFQDPETRKWSYSWTKTKAPPEFLPIRDSGRPAYPKARTLTLRVLFPLLAYPTTAETLLYLYPETLELPSPEALRRRLRTLLSNSLVTRTSGYRPEWHRTPLWESLEKNLPPLPPSLTI